MTSDQKQTLVEEGTDLKGALRSSCPVVVRGRVEGELEAPSLTISKTGVVHGKTKVGLLTSEGELAGEIDADEVRLSGKINDGTVLRAKSIEVKLAQESPMQVVFGECELNVGEDPSAEDSPKRSKRRREPEAATPEPETT